MPLSKQEVIEKQITAEEVAVKSACELIDAALIARYRAWQGMSIGTASIGEAHVVEIVADIYRKKGWRVKYTGRDGDYLEFS